MEIFIVFATLLWVTACVVVWRVTRPRPKIEPPVFKPDPLAGATRVLLTELERLVYTSGTQVPKKELVEAMLRFAERLEVGTSGERSPVLRHGDEWIRPEEEQTLINRASGVEERTNISREGNTR